VCTHILSILFYCRFRPCRIFIAVDLSMNPSPESEEAQFRAAAEHNKHVRFPNRRRNGGPEPGRTIKLSLPDKEESPERGPAEGDDCAAIAAGNDNELKWKANRLKMGTWTHVTNQLYHLK